MSEEVSSVLAAAQEAANARMPWCTGDHVTIGGPKSCPDLIGMQCVLVEPIYEYKSRPDLVDAAHPSKWKIRMSDSTGKIIHSRHLYKIDFNNVKKKGVTIPNEDSSVTEIGGGLNGGVRCSSGASRREECYDPPAPMPPGQGEAETCIQREALAASSRREAATDRKEAAGKRNQVIAARHREGPRSAHESRMSPTAEEI